MRMNKTLLLLLLFILSVNILNAQTIKVEQDALYGSKINMPVTIEVVKTHMKYVFYAHNKSYYPYTVHLEVTEIVNLSPPSVDRTYKVNPGRSMLCELKTQDLSRTSNYRYEYTYSIGAKGGKVDSQYPYLIPTKNAFDVVSHDAGSNDILANQFKMSSGDTIYATRRGKVVATPNLSDDMERVSENMSYEILHKDGTIMIYENIDPDFVIIPAGKQVLPGQAIGLINKEAILELILYQSTGDGYLKALDIHYFVDEDHVEPFSEKLKNYPVIHPMSIITKEFKRSELKSLAKGELAL